MYKKKLFICPFYRTAEKLDFISSFSYFLLKRVLTLPVLSLLVFTPDIKGGGGGGVGRTPCYLKNSCSYELEILLDIRDIFEHLRNIKVVYLVFTWLP